jgi:hypothetical protein
MRTIGWAVKEMQDGARVRREGWNGKGMWLAIEHPRPILGQLNMTTPYVYLSTAQGAIVPWTCSQSDLLATDWEGA